MTDVIQVSVRRDPRTSVWSVARSTAATIASRRVRIINDGGGGWRVRCDEAWGEGNGTDDWTAPQCSAYCRHSPPTPRWCVKQNTATDRVANFCHRNNANYYECHRKRLNLAFVFLCLFCVVVHFFWLVTVCFCCVRFSFSIPGQEIDNVFLHYVKGKSCKT